MSHIAYTQWNRVDSWLLVVRNQIANLTSSLSFCHNLCYRCPNDSSKPNFDMYILIAFLWYKERLNARCFDPWNWTLKFWESRKIHNDALPSHGVKPNWGFHKVKLRKVETWRHAPGFQL
jgi:hypothetical protein